MNIVEKEGLVSLSEGPQRVLGIFIFVIFGLPASSAGTLMVLGYLGIFPSDESDFSMLALGAIFFIVGILFMSLGIQLFLSKKLLELTTDSVNFSLIGLFKKTNRVYSVKDIDKIDFMLTNDDYRNGREGSLLIRLKNSDKIECFTDTNFKDLELAAKKISELNIEVRDPA